MLKLQARTLRQPSSHVVVSVSLVASITVDYLVGRAPKESEKPGLGP